MGIYIENPKAFIEKVRVLKQDEKLTWPQIAEKLGFPNVNVLQKEIGKCVDKIIKTVS